MNRISVLLLESHARFRQYVVRFLQEHAADTIVVLDAINWREAASLPVYLCQPDVVLFGVSAAALADLQRLPRLRELFPHTDIVVLSVLDTDEYQRIAAASGARAFLQKDTLATQLVPAITQVVSQRKRE